MLSSSLLSMIIINQPGYLISNTAKTFLKMAATYYQQWTDYNFVAFYLCEFDVTLHWYAQSLFDYRIIPAVYAHKKPK